MNAMGPAAGLHPEAAAENYYPDWSRTTFMDIRNVERLTVDGIRFHALRRIHGILYNRRK